MLNRFRGWLAIPLVAFACVISRNASAVWLDYSGANYSVMAVANVSPVSFGNPQGNGLVCGMRYQGLAIDCFYPAGDQSHPDHVTAFTIGNQQMPSGEAIFSLGLPMRSITIRPWPGFGYFVYALRSDGAIFAAFMPFAQRNTNWQPVLTAPSTIIPRQIYWSQTSNVLVMVATNNHLYTLSSGTWVQ